jgi:hypothetical protein
MTIVLRIFSVLLILIYLVAPSCGKEQGTGEVIDRGYPSPSPTIKKEISASNSPLPPSFSSSRSSIPIVGQIPIIISKYTKNLKTEYGKKENITIRIRILNCDKRNKIEKAYLLEEIAEGLSVISPVVSNSSNPKIFNDDGIQYLLWNFDEGLPNIKHVEYTLQGTKTGLHNFVSTVVSTSVLDRYGVTHDIISVSEDLTINIKNNPPKLISYYFLFNNESKENPIYVQKKNRLRQILDDMLHHRDRNLSIQAIFSDKENDTINCYLVFNDSKASIKPSNGPLVNGKILFKWDLSNYTTNNQNFNLVADDGESNEQIGPFEIKTFWVTDKEKYANTITGTLGAIGLLGATIIYFRGGLSDLFNRIKKFRKKGRGRERNKNILAIQWR